jgi:FAD:protein FMN transferase
MTAVHTTRAWSCTVRLVVEDPSALILAAEDLDTLLAEVDAVASRFRPDSALSIANRRAGRPTPIPRRLVELIGAALDAEDDTDGLVNPSLGLALQRIGYDRDIAEVPADGPAVTFPPPRRRRQVQLDRSNGLLTVPLGTALDLGATTKAYVADLAARQLSGSYGTAVMVELGGDLAVAGPRSDGWRVQVAEREGGSGQLILVRTGGVATSTTTIRRWQRGGQPMHHIIDPRTGAPAVGPWRTVSVAARSAFAANVASTAAIILGPDAVAWLEARNLAARLIGSDGGVHCTAGWPALQPAAVAS